jgi:hypothetical protein
MLMKAYQQLELLACGRIMAIDFFNSFSAFQKWECRNCICVRWGKQINDMQTIHSELKSEHNMKRSHFMRIAI